MSTPNTFRFLCVEEHGIGYRTMAISQDRRRRRRVITGTSSVTYTRDPLEWAKQEQCTVILRVKHYKPTAAWLRDAEALA